MNLTLDRSPISRLRDSRGVRRLDSTAVTAASRLAGGAVWLNKAPVNLLVVKYRFMNLTGCNRTITLRKARKRAARRRIFDFFAAGEKDMRKLLLMGVAAVAMTTGGAAYAAFPGPGFGQNPLGPEDIITFNADGSIVTALNPAY
jgi:hypothetical protein